MPGDSKRRMHSSQLDSSQPRCVGTGTGRAASGIRLRDAAPGDCAAIAAIYNEAIRSRRATMDTEPVGAADFEARLAALTPREALLVAGDAGPVAGWGIVKRYSDRPGYAVACETSVYVAEAAQGRGIGARLLDALVVRAGALGYRHLVAKIMGVNERSVEFHARHGFDLVGRQRDVGRIDGISHDIVIMQRLLPHES